MTMTMLCKISCRFRSFVKHLKYVAKKSLYAIPFFDIRKSILLQISSSEKLKSCICNWMNGRNEILLNVHYFSLIIIDKWQSYCRSGTVYCVCVCLQFQNLKVNCEKYGEKENSSYIISIWLTKFNFDSIRGLHFQHICKSFIFGACVLDRFSYFFLSFVKLLIRVSQEATFEKRIECPCLHIAMKWIIVFTQIHICYILLWI